MTVPVISALIKSHPNAKISVLTKVQFTPLFKHLPTVEVIGVDLKNWVKQKDAEGNTVRKYIKVLINPFYLDDEDMQF